MIEYIALVVAGLAGGFGLGLLVKGRVAAGKIKDAEAEAARIITAAEREAATVELVREIASYLRASRTNPELKFRA